VPFRCSALAKDRQGTRSLTMMPVRRVACMQTCVCMLMLCNDWLVASGWLLLLGEH
jgi:hypothetical protein